LPASTQGIATGSGVRVTGKRFLDLPCCILAMRDNYDFDISAFLYLRNGSQREGKEGTPEIDHSIYLV